MRHLRYVLLLLIVLLAVCFQHESVALLVGNGAVPMITSITGQDTGGGQITITGTGFGAGSTNLNAVHVWCDTLTSSARPAPPNREFLPIISLSSTQIVAFAGTYDAGTYDCRIENLGGATDSAPQSLKITATSDPSVVFGAQLDAWWRSDSGVSLSGGVVGQWTDKTSHAYIIGATGTGRPTYNTSSSNFGSFPSITFNGTTNALSLATSVSLGSTTQECMFIVYREVTNATNRVYFDMSTAAAATVYRLQSNGTNPPTPQFVDTAGTATQPNTVTVGTPAQFYACVNSSGHNLAINNSTPTTTTFTDTVASTSMSVTIGATSGLASFSNIEVVEAFLVSGAPTTTQLANVAAYENLRYNLGSPQPTLVTNIPTTGGGYRVKGTNFLNGATLAVSNGLESVTTAGFNSSTSIESTVGAGTYALGTYDVTVTNPDGGNITLVNSLRVTSVADPMVIAGLSVIGWYDFDAPYVTLSGSFVTGLIDRSYINDMIQNTGGDQATYNATDAVYSGHASATFNGTSTFVFDGSASADSGTATWLQTISNFDSANTNVGNAITDFSNGQFSEARNQNGVPNCNRSTITAAWGSTQSGAARSVTCSVPTGANPTITLNVSNGIAITASGTANAVNTSRILTMGARYNGSTVNIFYKGTISKVVVLNATPNSTQRGQFETWAQQYGAP